MDLQGYYQKLRDTEKALPARHTYLVSLVTPDGGKPGVITETPTPIAARMIVEGAARKATDDEVKDFRGKQSAARHAAEDAAKAAQVRLVVVSNPQPSTGKDR